MSTLAAGVDDAIAGATTKADRRQADYFRELLQKQSSQLSDNIGSYYRRLTRHQVRNDFAEVRRMRRMIRAAEQEQRSLAWGFDCSFSTRDTTSPEPASTRFTEMPVSLVNLSNWDSYQVARPSAL